MSNFFGFPLSGGLATEPNIWWCTFKLANSTFVWIIGTLTPDDKHWLDNPVYHFAYVPPIWIHLTLDRARSPITALFAADLSAALLFSHFVIFDNVIAIIVGTLAHSNASSRYWYSVSHPLTGIMFSIAVSPLPFHFFFLSLTYLLRTSLPTVDGAPFLIRWPRILRMLSGLSRMRSTLSQNKHTHTHTEWEEREEGEEKCHNRTQNIHDTNKRILLMMLT